MILSFFKQPIALLMLKTFWRTQWRGKLFFAYDSIHSWWVMILVRSDLDFNPRTIRKFNASLVNDDDFVALINESVPLWLEEFKEVIDKRMFLDLIKYRIRQIFAIK